MAKYLFVYHGGTQPESDDDRAKRMDKWGAWFGSMGAALIDGGNPLTGTTTVNSNGSVTQNGGANPVGGYSLIEAASIDDAHNIARGCPHLAYNGSIQVGEALDM